MINMKWNLNRDVMHFRRLLKRGIVICTNHGHFVNQIVCVCIDKVSYDRIHCHAWNVCLIPIALVATSVTKCTFKAFFYQSDN